MIVVKFGGTSVGDAAAIERAAAIVRTRLSRKPVVVVSALAGTTNALLEIADHAAKGQLITAVRGVETLRERHLEETERLLGPSSPAHNLSGELSVMFDELASLAGALAVLGHLTPRSLDAVTSLGEKVASHMVVAAFAARGLPAELIDAREVVVTDDRFTRANPREDALSRAAREKIVPSLKAGRVPVVAGYIGATEDGITTTLGRGGSDFTAALIGSALGARAIEIWTDVDGMLTADPRIVENARLIEQIRFDEASELASFGAKVLHPSTIAPAVRRGIPVYIFNSSRPEGCGTKITAEAPRRAVSAIAGKGDVTVVKIRSSRMLLASGFLNTLFAIFERHHTSVDVVATSEVSVSVTVDDPSRLELLVPDLKTLGDVSVERHRAIVALVGAGLGDSSRTMAAALAALGDIRVRMISLSATEINLTIIVDGDQLAPAMRALHERFFGAGSRA